MRLKKSKKNKEKKSSSENEKNDFEAKIDALRNS